MDALRAKAEALRAAPEPEATGLAAAVEPSRPIPTPCRSSAELPRAVSTDAQPTEQQRWEQVCLEEGLYEQDTLVDEPENPDPYLGVVQSLGEDANSDDELVPAVAWMPIYQSNPYFI